MNLTKQSLLDAMTTARYRQEFSEVVFCYESLVEDGENLKKHVEYVLNYGKQSQQGL